jgi:hypothetical protein
MSAEELAPLAGTSDASDQAKGDTQSIARSARPRKWRRILTYLVDGGALTRFDAERLGDHALNSTIAQLGKRGITIDREAVVIEGRFGSIHCLRYRLAPASVELARQLLRQ